MQMIKIRRANEKDIPQLENLFLVSRKKAFPWEDSGKFKKEDYLQSTAGESVFVAEDNDGQILGFISIYEEDSPPFIHNLYVLPAHQRKGVGRMLIESLIPWLEGPYRLKCLIRNRNALLFYLTQGWKILEQGNSEKGDFFVLELPAK